MEYLSRILTVPNGHEHFKFHPRCKDLKLNHLCFADDLMLFCKGLKLNQLFIWLGSLILFNLRLLETFTYLLVGCRLNAWVFYSHLNVSRLLTGMLLWKK